jgi:hypothetical protein
MCYFVFVGVPERHHGLLAELFAAARFDVHPTSNLTVHRIFPDADAIFTVCHGGCSCDVYARRDQALADAAMRTKYEKKGWSASKIEKALRSRRSPEKPQVEAFGNSFASLVKAVGSARLFAHSFAGNVETEEVVTDKRSTLTLSTYLEHGGAYPVDVVHDIRVQQLD